jgi:hypothetical protein
MESTRRSLLAAAFAASGAAVLGGVPSEARARVPFASFSPVVAAF